MTIAEIHLTVYQVAILKNRSRRQKHCLYTKKVTDLVTLIYHRNLWTFDQSVIRNSNPNPCLETYSVRIQNHWRSERDLNPCWLSPLSVFETDPFSLLGIAPKPIHYSEIKRQFHHFLYFCFGWLIILIMKSRMQQLTYRLENKNRTEEKGSFFSTLLIEGSLLLLISLATYCFVSLGALPLKDGDLQSLTYSEGREFSYSVSLLKTSAISGGILTILAFALMYLFGSKKKRKGVRKKRKAFVAEFTFALFGILAFIVIALFANGFHFKGEYCVLIATLPVCLYDFLIYHLEAEGMTYSNKLFWEIFRFALVGLIAGVFDFLTCYLLQFVLFRGNTAGYVTGISTAGGFIIGVIINYLMSTFMVYRAAKTNTGKSVKGMTAFLVLAIIGLFIGIGTQYFLYDFLALKKGISFLSYPLDFVIRTLLVMVYNYITRKLFIYR